MTTTTTPPPDDAAAVPQPSLGGSYTRDPSTGQLTREQFTEPAPDVNADASAE